MDNTNLTTEQQIAGENVETFCHHTFERKIWMQLSVRRRGMLTECGIGILHIVQELHAAGYVHGSIRLNKFGVKDGRVYLADTSATAVIGNTEQDIYSLGLLLIHLFTDYLPFKFDIQRLDRLQESLFYYIPDGTIVTLIVSCLSNEAQTRPSVENIIQVLDAFYVRDRRQVYSDGVLFGAGMLQQSVLERLLQQSIQLPVAAEGPLAPLTTGDWKDGLAGWRYLCARYQLGVGYIAGNQPAVPVKAPGLYEGLAGIAIALAAIGVTDLEGWWIWPPATADIANGAAGQGLAALHAVICDGEKARVVAWNYAAWLMEAQQEDGSWPMPEEAAGFSGGMAGIACFLWLYYSENTDDRVAWSATTAMDWLRQQQVPTPWLSDGVAGVALSFITAYKATGRWEYREEAERLLYLLPDHLHTGHFGYLQGIAGLGDTYLEAWQVFQNPDWQKRAYHIVNELIHVNKLHENGRYYWITEAEQQPIAGLLTGNAGILYFLMRYTFGADKVPHLLFPAVSGKGGV